MGNKSSQSFKDPLMSEKCRNAREKISVAREKFLSALKEECDQHDGDIDFDYNSLPHHGDENCIEIDPTHYSFPFENLVLEGGGVKGLVYGGAGKELEEHGILKQIHRFAGASAGAISAALFAVGFNSYDVEHIMKVDLEPIICDAPYGYFSLIPNMISGYGWHPGVKLMKFLGEVISMKTGDPDITFAEVYKQFGNELCIIIANVNTMSEEYCHVKTTPDMPVRLAVRMSMSIPGLFQSLQSKLYHKTNNYVDGGVFCNYPIHCYDGWWLSMKQKDSFLHRIQPIGNIVSLMDRNNRFESGADSTKTLGCIVFSLDEDEYHKQLVLKKSGVPMGKLPNTKLARNWAKADQGKCKIHNVYADVTEAATEFFNVMQENDLDGNNVISKEEFKKAFSEAGFKEKYSKLLFGEECGPDLAFDALDRDDSGSINYNELLNFIEVTGVCMQETYLGVKRKEIDGFFSFLGTIFNALSTNAGRKFTQSSDINRTIGISSWYIKTTNFDLEDEDKNFLINQGRKSTLKYLQHFVRDNKLEKVSEDVINARDIPYKPSLTDAQLEAISKM
ncbi:uncharacterized protein LOC134706357 isoform X1 [Mytilus trossulus]|uniref:uncharacterized protein LOC134706357 isoform X1 n=1 Tax=Mytilus trossulus TaxID=6551 RepID=UPI003007CCCA